MSLISFYAGRLVTAENDQLKAEVARLHAVLQNVELRCRQAEAELAELRPAPVVEVRYYNTGLGLRHSTPYPEEGDDLALTFTDGVLTAAEVLK